MMRVALWLVVAEFALVFVMLAAGGVR